MAADDRPNFDVFRESFSAALLERISTSTPQAKPRSRRKARARRASPEPPSASAAPPADAEDLSDFIDYLASESFAALPPALQALSYTATQADPSLAARFAPADIYPGSELADALLAAVPPCVPDTLATYFPSPRAGPDGGADAPHQILCAALADYAAAATAPPPAWAATRADACEICARAWVPLSYHHLIPRSTHDRVVKRGWHEEWRLGSVAWLCRACHSFVHRAATNEELAREFWTVDRLMARDDVREWAAWVGRVRWKAK